jgi:hypothetical protein
MELFLNLLWVLIAAAAIGLWRICWVHEDRSRRRQPVREWTAMGCALVLLFFAVSLTDDLHSEALLLEDCSTSRRHSMCSSHHSPHSKCVVREIGPATLSGSPEMSSLAFGSIVVSFSSEPSPIVLPDHSDGRAPPVALL